MDNFGAVGGAFVFDDSDTVAAGALHLGLDIPLSDNIILTGRYAMVLTGDANFTATDGINTASKDSDIDNVFMAGVRIPFGN
jgi:opacity protein-like surface antigen